MTITPKAREAAQEECTQRRARLLLIKDAKPTGHFVQLAIDEAVKPLVELLHELNSAIEHETGLLFTHHSILISERLAKASNEAAQLLTTYRKEGE